MNWRGVETAAVWRRCGGGAAAVRRAQSTWRRDASDWRVSKLYVQQQERVEHTRESPSLCQNRIFSLKFGQLKRVFSTLNFDFKVRSTQSPNLLIDVYALKSTGGADFVDFRDVT
jgi:hypothetical protein